MKKTRKPVKLRVPTVPTSQVVYAAQNIALDFFSQSRAEIDMVEVPDFHMIAMQSFAFTSRPLNTALSRSWVDIDSIVCVNSSITLAFP